MLLRRGVSVNCQSKDNRATPLIIASKYGHYAVVDLLLSYGANVNLRTYADGDTALIIASLNGFVDIVQLLTEKGAGINTGDNAGRTSLICASQNGHDQVVNYLIEKGALLNIKNANGLSAFSYACNNGNIHIVERLIHLPVCIDSPDSENLTPLLRSSLQGFLPIVELLVEHGANINYTDKQGRSPLMAASQAGHLNVVKYLVEKGANMNLVTVNGMTAKDYAFVNSHSEVSDWLEQTGAKAGVGAKLKRNQNRSKRNFGIAPSIPSKQTENVAGLKKEKLSSGTEQKAQEQLVDMCKNGWGFEDTISYEILKGANVNLKDGKGVTPLIMALQNGHTKHAMWLLKMGADVNVVDNDFVTPLMYASKIGDLDLVERMVEYKCNINVFDSKGRNALFYAKQAGSSHVSLYLSKCSYGSYHETLVAAIKKGDVNEIEIILQECVDLNQIDEEGRTYLIHCVLSVNSSQTIAMLCSKGAKVNCKDQNGDTPLLMCIRHSDADTLRVLLEYSADIYICNNFDQNALLEACIRGNYEMLQMILMQKGSFSEECISKALKYAVFCDDQHVFYLAAQYCRETAIKCVYDKEFIVNCHKKVIEFMVQNDDIPTWKENIPLLNSLIEQGESELVEMVVANMDLTNQDYDLALNLSLSRGMYGIAAIILNIMSTTTREECEYLVCDHLFVKGDPVSLNKHMRTVYKIFTRIIIRESPKCIKGFSRDWHKPVIYINVESGTVDSAKEFIEEKVKKDKRMNIVTFEYIVKRSSTKYLMQSSNNPSINAKISSGSIVFEANCNDTNKLLRGSLRKENIDNRFGSLGCLMHKHDNEMVDSSLWGVTAGHLFIPRNIQGPSSLLSEHCDQTTQHPKICELANKYKACNEIVETKENMATVDCALFPILTTTQKSDLCSINIESIRNIPEVLYGSDLLNRQVYKLGYMTGRTEGVVTNADIGITIGTDLLCGLFLVEPSDRRVPFAQIGDSGSAVIDINNGYVLGLICAVEEVTKSDNCRINLVYCTRFDQALQYAQEKWNIVLSFNEHSETFKHSSLGSDNQMVGRCECGLANEVTELRNRYEEERKGRYDIQTKLQELQTKSHKEKVNNETIIVKLQKENDTLRQYIKDLESKLETANIIKEKKR